MEIVSMIRTFDGEIHETKQRAQRHLDNIYGKNVDTLKRIFLDFQLKDKLHPLLAFSEFCDSDETLKIFDHLNVEEKPVLLS